MPHVTIEYVIMVPILIMQIFLFPLTASWLMNVWIDSRRMLAVQDTASHLGSTIQQLYFSLNHESISAGAKATYTPGLAPYIENIPYYGNATLRTVSSQQGAGKVLDLSIRLLGTNIRATSVVVLGPNVAWQSSTFKSNSTNVCINAQKIRFPNGTVVISLRFIS
jgi:hypothetical protein